ncbi:unnamed protein product, partial [marine sediment metagenome]
PEVFPVIALNIPVATNGNKSRADSLGEHRGKYIDMMYWKAIAQNFYPMRIDADSTYEYAGTLDTTGTTTTLDCTGLDQLDDHWIGGVVSITSGNNKGMGGYISDFVSSTDILTITETLPSYALNESSTTETFKIATSTGLTSADPLSLS